MHEVWEQVHTERQWGAYPNEHLVRWACGHVDKTTHYKVLDLGCGQGASAWFLAREGFRVTAVDFSASAIAKCRKRLESEGLGLITAVCDVADLPFKDESFDLVVDVISIAHNTKHKITKIFDEVARVLKPKGKLFSVTPTNKCSRHPFMKYGTISFMERFELEQTFQQDFTNLELLTTSYEVSAGCKVENWIVTADRKVTQGA